MRLRVRIEDGGAAGLPEVQALWERCTAAINPPPIPDIDEVLYGVSYGATNGFARAVPELPPRSQDLIVSQALFTLPPERQELTILHELLHLSIAHGALAQRWARERQLRARYPNPRAGLPQGASPERVHHADVRHFLAFYFFTTPDEILAERALRDGYHDQLTERLRQHIAMRADNLNNSPQDTAHPQLRKYWLALELQRTAMMIDVADEGPERTALETIRDTHRALLVAEAGDAEAQRLIDLVARINRYQVGDPDSEAACDEAFAEIMGLAYPEPAAADDG
jgi:hypothetical protein